MCVDNAQRHPGRGRRVPLVHGLEHVDCAEVTDELQRLCPDGGECHMFLQHRGCAELINTLHNRSIYDPNCDLAGELPKHLHQMKICFSQIFCDSWLLDFNSSCIGASTAGSNDCKKLTSPDCLHLLRGDMLTSTVDQDTEGYHYYAQVQSHCGSLLPEDVRQAVSACILHGIDYPTIEPATTRERRADDPPTSPPNTERERINITMLHQLHACVDADPQQCQQYIGFSDTSDAVRFWCCRMCDGAPALASDGAEQTHIIIHHRSGDDTGKAVRIMGLCILILLLLLICGACYFHKDRQERAERERAIIKTLQKLENRLQDAESGARADGAGLRLGPSLVETSAQNARQDLGFVD